MIITMSHPCHTLSNPSAQLFWCRHCMKIFEDPIQRWRHSKTCKKLVTSNPEHKIVGRDGRLLDVRAGNTENQVIITDIKTQKDKIGTRKPKNLSELNCYICKKGFDSFESMKEHVKRSCNRPDIGPNKDTQSVTSQSLLVDRSKNDNVSVQIESLLKAAQQHQEQEQQKQQQQHQQQQLTDTKCLPENTPIGECLKDIHVEVLSDRGYIKQLQSEQKSTQAALDGSAVDRLHKNPGTCITDNNAEESPKHTAVPHFILENSITDTIEPMSTVITEVHIVTQNEVHIVTQVNTQQNEVLIVTQVNTQQVILQNEIHIVTQVNTQQNEVHIVTQVNTQQNEVHIVTQVNTQQNVVHSNTGKYTTGKSYRMKYITQNEVLIVTQVNTQQVNTQKNEVHIVTQNKVHIVTQVNTQQNEVHSNTGKYTTGKSYRMKYIVTQVNTQQNEVHIVTQNDVHIVTQGNTQQGIEEDNDSDCTFVPPRCRIPAPPTNIHYTETINRTPKPISTIDHECVLLSDSTVTDGETNVLSTGAVQTVLNESKTLKRKTSDCHCFVSKPKKVKTPHTRLRVLSEEIVEKSFKMVDVEHVTETELGLREKENILNEVHLQTSQQNNNCRLNSLPFQKGNCVNNSPEISSSEIPEITSSNSIMSKTVEMLPAVEKDKVIQMNVVSEKSSSKENKSFSETSFVCVKELSLSKSDNGTSELIVKDSGIEKCDTKIKVTQKVNEGSDKKISKKESNKDCDIEVEKKSKKEIDKNETKEKNKDKKEGKAKIVHPKKKQDKPVKCKICDREFKSSQALQKHNKVPCKIKHTRNLTQKVLRPKRTTVQKPQLPELRKKKNNSSKAAVNNKPKLLLRSDRRYSDTILSVKSKKSSKNKNRRKTLSEYNFHFSCCKQYDNSKQGFQVDYESLSEKEQYFFHLEMIPISRLPSDMHSVVITHRNLVNTSFVKENIEDDILNGPFLPPPVLEKIPDMIVIESDCNRTIHNEAELEPPVLEAISEINANAVLSEIEVVTKSQSVNTVVSNSLDIKSQNLHETNENADECTVKKVENRHFLDVITKLSPNKITDICCKTSLDSKPPAKQISVEPISPSKYSTNRHFTDIITVSSNSSVTNNKEISSKDYFNSNNDDRTVADEQKNNSIMQNQSATRHLKFGHENGSSNSRVSDLKLDKNENSFFKVTVGIQTENNSPEKVIYPSSSSSSRLNSQPGKNEVHAIPNEKVKPQLSRNLFESFLNIGERSVASKKVTPNVAKLTDSSKSCHIPVVNSAVSQNSVSHTAKDKTVKGNNNNKNVNSTNYQEIMVYPPKKELPISAPGPSVDKETTSNNNELLELLAKSLGIYPESQNSQSDDKIDSKKNVSSCTDFNSGNKGATTKPSITKTNLGDGNVQIIILNNSASSQDYTTDINVIDIPKPLQKKNETFVKQTEKSKNTYVPVCTGYVNNTNKTKEIQDNTDCTNTVMKSILPQQLQLHRTSSSSSGIVRPVSVPLTLSDSSCTTLRLQGPTLEENSESSGIPLMKDNCVVSGSTLNHVGQVYTNSVIFNNDTYVQDNLNSATCTDTESPCDISYKSANNKLDANTNRKSFDLSQSSSVNIFLPASVKNSHPQSTSDAVSHAQSTSDAVSYAQSTSDAVSISALNIPERNLDEPCVMVQYIEQVQDSQNVSYVYLDDVNTNMMVDNVKYTEESNLTSPLTVSYTL
ncbi:hypothetical protein KUTeg_023281 [Tegillarca granosa]|uniref:C2H2-type domain-containing protein n=1 Tax=Tegillarca granosa TaxID=220873 RepID=A0ABQ9E478_TEGGR|nr:hypothetical protein KUTeg_023281 [Tegillarca granosa]